MSDRVALIVGAGAGLGAALAKRCAARGMAVQLAARNTEKLNTLADEIDAAVYCCDASNVNQVSALFAALDNGPGAPDLVVYNPSYRQRAPFIELDPDDVMSYYNRARSKYSLQDYSGVIEDNIMALELLKKNKNLPAYVPNNIKQLIYLNNGLSRNGLMEFELAINDFTEAIKLDSINFVKVGSL